MAVLCKGRCRLTAAAAAAAAWPVARGLPLLNGGGKRLLVLFTEPRVVRPTWFTLNKAECSRQVTLRSHVCAWNNGIGLAVHFVGLVAK